MLACEMRWCDKQCNNQFSFVIEHSKKKSLTSFANLCPSQKGLSRKSFTCFSIHIYIFLIFASGVYGTQRMNHHIFHWPFLKCHHCANSYCTNMYIWFLTKVHAHAFLCNSVSGNTTFSFTWLKFPTHLSAWCALDNNLFYIRMFRSNQQIAMKFAKQMPPYRTNRFHFRLSMTLSVVPHTLASLVRLDDKVFNKRKLQTK